MLYNLIFLRHILDTWVQDMYCQYNIGIAPYSESLHINNCISHENHQEVESRQKVKDQINRFQRKSLGLKINIDKHEKTFLTPCFSNLCK